MAIYWKRKDQRRGQEVPLCFIEMKFGLNTDIKEVHKHVHRYHNAINLQSRDMAKEAEKVFRQKLELGLYEQSFDMIEAMKTLMVANDPKKFRFILVLIDYNPYSKLLNLDSLRQLPFADQLSIFHGGFAMWQDHLESVYRTH